MVKEKVEIALNDPQLEILNSIQPFNLAMFGQGTGKTHIAGVISADFVLNFPEVYGFIGANTHKQLTQSTMLRIRTVWKEEFGITEWTKENKRGCYVVGVRPPAHFNTEKHEFDSYHGIISFEWGTVVYYGSLENYKAHDGKEFGWAVLDETKDTREEALKEVIIGRLRMPGIYIKDELISADPTGTPFNPLYIFTTPAKVPWINEFFNLEKFHDEILRRALSEEDFFHEDTAHNMKVVIASTYHNLYNLPSNYIQNRTTGLSEQQIQMLIYAIPFAKSGGEAYKDFDFSRNTYEGNKYDPESPIFLSFDFNVLPYVTLKPYQIHKGEEVYIIYALPEICMKPPKNSTASACREFKKRYKNHKGGVIIMGDPSGKQRDTRSEGGKNDFTIIRSELSEFSPTERVAKKAPPVNPRINFLNAIFRGELGIEYYELKSNSESVREWMYCKEGPDGKKLKEKVKNKDTGQTYEKYGHISDATEYFICPQFKKEFAQFSGVKRNINVS